MPFVEYSLCLWLTWLKNSTKSPIPVAVGLFSCIYPRKRMYEPLLISQLILFFISLLVNSAISPHVNLVTSLFLRACFQGTGLLLLEEDAKTGAQTQDLYSSVFCLRHFTVTYQLSSLVPRPHPHRLKNGRAVYPVTDASAYYASAPEHTTSDWGHMEGHRCKRVYPPLLFC